MSAAGLIAALKENRACLYRTLAGENSDPAVAAFNRRSGALAAIEMRSGGFYTADNSAPARAEVFDNAEEALRFVDAETLHGVLAKLWVALAHLGPSPTDAAKYGHAERADEIRGEHGAVRRADTAEVESFISGWDFGEEVLFGAIRDLERMTRETLR